MEVLKNLLQCFVQLGVIVKNKLQKQAGGSTSDMAHPFLCLPHAICLVFLSPSLQTDFSCLL